MIVAHSFSFGDAAFQVAPEFPNANFAGGGIKKMAKNVADYDQPFYQYRVTPSTVNVRPGGSTPIEVFALRHDGFNGPIQLSLAGDPRGLRLSGARIPPGRHRIRCTLTAPPTTPPGPLQLTLRGRALTADRTLDHPATPADDMMQAFLWRHLAPARLWLACVGPPKTRRPPVTIAGKLPVRIPAGGSADVTLKVPKWLVDRDLQLTPSDPPDGLAVSPPPPPPARGPPPPPEVAPEALEVDDSPSIVVPAPGTNTLVKEARPLGRTTRTNCPHARHRQTLSGRDRQCRGRL